jgi:hypothetical protein
MEAAPVDGVSLLRRDLRAIRSLVDLCVGLLAHAKEREVAEVIAAAVALDLHVRVVVENELIYPILCEIDGETGGCEGHDFFVGHARVRNHLVELCSSSAGGHEILPALTRLAAVAEDHFSRQERDALPELQKWLGADLLAKLGELVEHRQAAIHEELREAFS